MPASEGRTPKRIKPKALADYLEVMSKSVFQAGMSWKVVETKWDGTREVMANFDPDILATWGDAEVDRAATDIRLIRNRRKIQAVVDNACSMLEVAETPAAFRKYLRSHDDFEATVKALRKRFSFLGDFGAYYFLYVVGEQVPDYEAWCASRGVQPMTMR